jgi:hypothetical protein
MERETVHHLSRHIPGSKIEATLGVGGQGGKSVDILVRITPEYKRLLAAIAHNAHYLTSNHHDLATGDLVAIEVEVSDPTKTAPAAPPPFLCAPLPGTGCQNAKIYLGKRSSNVHVLDHSIDYPRCA